MGARGKAVGTQFARLAGIVLLATSVLGAVLFLAWLPLLDKIAGGFFLPTEQVRPARYSVSPARQMEFTTSDGVALAADVYHPIGLKRSPTILVRIPLTDTVWNRVRTTSIARFWAARGYTIVMQGTRGRYHSGGVFEPLSHEREDGIETMRWLQHQPWYNGKVATWGGSAFGQTQWAIADQHDPGVGAFFVQIASSHFYTVFHPGGAFALESGLYWALNSNGPRDRDVDMAALDRGAKAFPTLMADNAAGAQVPFFDTWVQAARDSAYWRNADGEDRARHASAPMLLLGGWYDPFLPTMLQDFADLSAENASRDTRLIIGPYAHAREIVWPGAKLAEPYRRASVAPALAWFDSRLAVTTAALRMPRVRIFVLGENVWRDENEWPLARTNFTSLYLREGGRLLNEASQDRDAHDHYLYDPRNPVPTLGGAMIGPRGGVARQAPIGTRADVLSFVTPVLEKPVEITGPVRAVLWVATDAPSTDFTAKLSDVYPDGAAYNLVDGILRREYARGAKTRIEIELGPISVLVPPGHRLRLDVSSSNHPRFDRNPNTGERAATATQTIVANQTLWRGAGAASEIVLPIIPR